MSHRLFLFNPDHDMALANFTPYYQPPSEIIRMANDLSVLPLWYAGEGDKVKVDAAERVESWHSPYFPFRSGWTEEWESLRSELASCIDRHPSVDLSPMGFPKDWRGALGIA